MKQRAYLILLAFTLLGLGATAFSSVVHYRLLNDPMYTSVCDVNATLSCTSAYASSYGSLLGTPVALLGVLWFAAVLGLLVAGRPGAGRLGENVLGYVFALSTVGLALTLYLAYGSLFVLQTLCIFCAMTWVAVVGLFVVSGSQTQYSMATLPRRLTRDLQAAAANPIALTVLIMFAVGAGSAIAFFPKDASGGEAVTVADVSSGERSEIESWFDSQPRVDVPAGETGDAVVVVVKFNDYQCPACRATYLNYKPIFQKYEEQAPGKVVLVTKHFPLDPECNVHTPTATHVLSCEAAVGVSLTEQAEREKLEDWIFANQSVLTPDTLIEAIRDVGGVADFETKYSQTLDQIKADIDLGERLQVNATPTFYINGVKVSGGLQPQYLDAIIAYELRRQTSQS